MTGHTCGIDRVAFSNYKPGLMEILYRADNPNPRPQSLAKRRVRESLRQAGASLLQSPEVTCHLAPELRFLTHAWRAPDIAYATIVPSGEKAGAKLSSPCTIGCTSPPDTEMARIDAAAAEITLTPDEVEELEHAVPQDEIVGGRYAAAHM